MVLALALSANHLRFCSSMLFHSNSLNPSPSSLQLSHHSPPTSYSQLQPQPYFTLTKPQSSFRRRCSNSLATVDAQTASLISLFQEIGISFEGTQVLLLNNPDLTSVSIDSLRARVLSLHSLGFDHVTLYRLVTKRPTVLTATEIEPFLTFLRDELHGQIQKDQLNRLLTTTEPKFLVDFPHKVQFLVDRGFSVGSIVHVLNKVNLPKALCHRSVDEIDRTISFLEPFGGISLILKQPAVLNFDLDSQLIPRIKVLNELSGGDEDRVKKVLLRFPAILNYSTEHVEGHIQFLRSFADLNDLQIFRVVLGFPAIVTTSRERKLRPRIQFLKDCGLNSAEIFNFLIKAPAFLSHSYHDNIACKLVFLVKIGYKYRTKDLAMAMRSSTRTNSENMQKVIGLFLSYGFSWEDIVVMSNKHPQILQYNYASLEKKIKYFIEEMDRDIEELLVFPAYLGYKFDERIKHRYGEKKSVRGGKCLSISF